jgi:hypothetical protein
MAALIDQRLRTIVRAANLNEPFVARVCLPEMSAEPALSVVHFHDLIPRGFDV